MAQLAIAALGAAIGGATLGTGVVAFGLTGTAIGWTLGSIAGSFLGPTQKTKGPRLEDLRVTGSEYGQAIPWIAGHPRIAGQIWWSSDTREIATTTEVGKGGGGAEYTSYTYEVDLLIGLCDREIGGVSRVWSNGKLVYTKRSESTAESALSSKAQADWDVMTVYTGAADQLPDPTYEAAVGVGNAPAYRGRGTVVIQGLQRGSSGQLPNLTFEVYEQGDEVGDTVTTLVEHFEGTSSFGRGAVAFSSPSFTFHFGQTDTVTVFQFTLGLEEPEILRTYGLVVGGFAPYNINTDVSGQVICNSGSTVMHWYNDDGAGTEFTLPNNQFAAGPVLARRGSAIVLGSERQSVSNTKELFRFATSGGTHAVTGDVLPYPVRSITIAGSYVYAVNAPGATLTADAVYVLDLATLTLQDTLAVPAAFNNYLYNQITTDENDNVFLVGSQTVWRLDGTAWTVVKDYTGNLLSGQLASRIGVFNGDLYAISYFNPPTVNRLSVVFEAVTLTEPTLQETAEALCARAGMPAGTYDASALSAITRPVRGLTVANVTSVRSVLEMLAGAYFFDAYLADKLYFVPRGGSVALSVANADMGAGVDQPAPDNLEVSIASETELPAQLALTYANADGDYNTATEYSDRLLSGVVSTSAVQLPLAMTAAEAKGVADAMLQDAYAGRITGQISLPQAYSRLVPTDVVTLTADDGTTYRARLVRRTDDGQTIGCEWVLDDASALVSAGITSTDYAPSLTVSLPGPTSLALMDIPLLRDADDTPGIYAAVKPVGSTSWPGAKVYSSLDGVEYTEAATASSRAIFGVTTTALTSYTGGNVFDTAGTVTVDVGAGTLASATRDALLDSNANAMLVGSEIIQFTTATYVSDGVYTLTGLLRGRRGTEWAMTGHASGETVVLLRTAGLVRIAYDAARIGQAMQYKAVTLGKTLASATARSLTDTGQGLAPLSVQDVRGARNALTGDIEVSFKRRSRLSAAFLATGGVPLGESSEVYEVDVYSDAGYTTLERTISATASPAAYTAAQQAADFGSLPSALWVKVYQISDTVGRGQAAAAALSGLDAAEAVSAYYNNTAAGTLVASNIDTRTSGAILYKQLLPAGVGAPNAMLLAGADGVAYAANTSSTGWLVTTDSTVTALGFVPGANYASAAGNVAVALAGAGIFERVEWTGDGTGARDVAHSMGVQPVLALVKRAVSEDWWMYSSEAGATVALRFPSGGAGAFAAAANAFPSLSTSTHLKIGSDLNANGVQHLALMFADSGADVDAGTYVGNGTATGPVVSLPWQADLLIIRNIDGSAAWTFVTCTALDGHPGGATHWLLDDQGTSPAYSAVVSLGEAGFQPISSSVTVNESGTTYQYWARKR